MATNRNWDHEVDVLVVGTGAGGMTAALRAAHANMNVLMVEKSKHYGGTSATSGGGLWIPCNHLMAECGIEDNLSDAFTYMKSVIGDIVAEKNIVAYAESAPRMLQWLIENSHLKYQAMAEYADYYQHVPGARSGGRTVDPIPYDARELGDDFLNMQEPHQQVRVMSMMGYSNTEGAILLSKSPGWLKVIMKLAWLYFSDIPWRFKSKRSRRLVMGNALIGRLRKSLMESLVPMWLDTPAIQLVAENDQVLGVVVARSGRPFAIRAKRGVILASGGFEHNQKLRERYLPQPTQEKWSAASPHNTGDMLVAGQAIGATTALMDEAWWGPTIVVQHEDRARALITERSMPGAIVVNKKAQRFFNESVAYTTATQAMYEPGNLPCYLIFDARYKRNYPFGPLLPDGMRLNWLQPKHVRKNLLKSGNTIAELATACNLDSANLTATIQRFNQFAENGKDEDFNRGENDYDLIYGDVRVKPNPCLAPLAEGPFYAIEIYPGDIGTKGGLLTNENAQVLGVNQTPIDKLYAVGNCAASVTGRSYPGAGATLGPAMTFGFLAAEDIIRKSGAKTSDRLQSFEGLQIVK